MYPQPKLVKPLPKWNRFYVKIITEPHRLELNLAKGINFAAKLQDVVSSLTWSKVNGVPYKSHIWFKIFCPFICFVVNIRLGRGWINMVLYLDAV